MWDGRIVGVGESWNESDPKTRDGIIWLIDSISSNLIKVIEDFRYSWEDSFVDLKQLRDGSLLIIGYSKNKSDQFQLRLLRLNEWNFEVISDNIYPGLSNAKVEKLILLSDWSILIGGINYLNNNEVVLYKFDENLNFLQKDSTKSELHFFDLKGMHELANKDIVICGNGVQEKNAKRANYYFISLLSSKLKLLDLGKSGKEPKIKDQEILFSHSNYDGTFTIVGSKFRSINAEPSWILEIDENGEIERKNNLINKTKNSKLLAGIKGYNKNILGFRSSFSIYDVLLYNNLEENEDSKVRLQGIRDRFKIFSVVLGSSDQFWIGGNNEDNIVTIIKINSSENSKSKSPDFIEPGDIKIVDGPSFVDGNNNVLNAGERGYIYFSLLNDGERNFYDGHITVSAIKDVSGKNYLKKRPISFIKKGGKTPIYIPISSGPDLFCGTTKFHITVFEQKKKKLDIYFNVESELTECADDIGLPISRGISITWVETFKKNENTGKLYKRNRTGIESLKFDIIPDRELKEDNIYIYIGNEVLVHNKSEISFEDKSGINTLKYSVEFKYHFDSSQIDKVIPIFLEVQSKNEFYRSDTVYFEFEKRKPNLYFLGIGPKKGLEYNDNDVNDFVKIMESQKQNGYYENFYSLILTSEEDTEKANILKKLAKFKNRFTNKNSPIQIYENDILVLFISSHGELINDKFHIVASDYDKEILDRTTINYQREIVDSFLNKINCIKLVLIDACHSGGSSKSLGIDKHLSNALNILAMERPGITTISSCSKEQMSYEDSNWENGAFTEAILEIFSNEQVKLLDGKNSISKKERKLSDGFLSIGELFNYLTDRVPDLCKKRFGENSLKRQVPFRPKKELNDTVVIFKYPN